MTVGYHVDAGRPRISYNCTGARSEWGGPHCQHLSGGCLDAYVAGQVLQVLSPAAVGRSWPPPASGRPRT
ncbi:MAG: hypothetical protein ACJ75E_04640 [Actinomycetes bacterium]